MLLEDRRMLSSPDIWIGGSDNNWLTAANWSAGVPTSASDVEIAAGDTVNLGSSSTVNSLDLGGSLNVTTGTLTISAAPASGNTLESSGALAVESGATVALAGGTSTLSAGSTVSGAGTVNFTGGTVNLSGSYEVTGATTVSGGTADFNSPIGSLGGSLTISAGAASFSTGSNVTVTRLTESNGTLTGSDTVTVTGLLTWTGGTMSGTGTTQAQGGIAVSGSSTETLSQRTLVNSATATWTSTGGFALQNGANFDNQLGATFNIKSNASWTVSGAGNLFTNAGTFEQSSGASSNSLAMPVTNNGSVLVQSGTLSLTGGDGLGSSGTFSASSGDTLVFGGGTFNLASNASVGGQGTVSFSGGTVNVSGTYNVAGPIVVNGGAVNFNAPISSVGSSLTISSGAASFSTGSNVTVPTLNDSGGTVVTSDTLIVSGTAAWSGGTLTGTGTVSFNGTITLSGSITLSGGVTVAGSSALTLSTGTLTVGMGGATYSGNSLTISGGTLTAGGTLTVNSTSTWSGGTLTGTGTVDFNRTTTVTGSETLSGGLTLAGTGAISLPSGTLTVAAGGATVTGSNFTISGGTVDTNGTLTLAGTASWTGGTIYGAGGVTNTGTFTLAASGNLELGNDGGAGGAITNSGTILDTGTGTLEFNASSGDAINNLASGLINLQTAAGFGSPLGGGGTLSNAGNFEKSAGSSGSTIGTTIAFSNVGGTIEVAAASLTLADGGSSTGGTFEVAAGTSLNLTGSGTYTGSYTLSGAGTVNTSGTFTVGSGGATVSGTNFTINGGTVVANAALTLAGSTSWTGGTIYGAGGVTNTGTFTLAATSGNLQLGNGGSAGGTIGNSGTILDTGTGTLEFNASSGDAINNLATGLINLQSSAGFGSPLGDGGTLSNAGTFEKSAGTSGSTIGTTIAFSNVGGTIDVTAASLTLADGGSSTGGAIDVAAGTSLNLTGSGTYSGTYMVSGAGTVNTSGTFTVGAAGTTISGGNLTVSGGTIVANGTLTLAGATSWTGGTIYGAGGVTNTGTLTLAAASGNLQLGNGANTGGTISNSGTILDTGTGTLEFNASSGDAINNLATGLINLQTAAGFGSPSGDGGTLSNAGTFEKSAGTSGSTVGTTIAFSNVGGTIEVAAASLTLADGGGSTGGAFEVAAGTSLNLTGSGTYTGTYVMSGTGTLNTSGTFTVGAAGATISGGNLTISNGAVVTNGTLTLAGATNWAGGTIYGPGALANTGTFTLTAASGSMQIGNSTTEPGTINNYGTIVDTATSTFGFYDSTSNAINNLAGGIINLQTDAGFGGFNGGAGTVTNAGTFEKSAGTNGSRIGATFNNTGGTIEVLAASLTLPGSGNSTGGTISVAAGTSLNLTGSASYTGTYTLSGAGTVNTSGTFTVGAAGATISGGNLTISNGTVVTSGTLTLGGATNWTGGTIYGPGGLTNTGTLTLSGSSGLALGNGTGFPGSITDSGTILETAAGSLSFNASGDALTVTASGVYNLASNAGIVNSGGNGTITNAGTLTKSAGTGTSTVTGPVSNSGVISGDAGTLNFSGTVAVSGSGILNSLPGTTLSFAGNLVGPTQNADQFAPLGNVLFNGSGTSSAPQLLEAMSDDLGPTAAGLQNNFAYGTLTLGNNTYVQLVDNAQNSPGSIGPEAVYVNTLAVPSGCKLNLNGLHLYAGTSQVAGTILDGSVSTLAFGLNVTNATTFENMQTTSGLVITPNAADVGTVTSFQITNIAGGLLFLNDAVTPVTDGEFITVAQGAAGLKFTPTTGSLANGSFTAEESTTGDASGLIAASTATATITVVEAIPPTFTADSPTTATVGSPYSYQFQATGSQPINFSATGLPGWAQLNSATGVLSGTPTTPGTFDFSMTASNGIAPNATINVSLVAQYVPPTFNADTPPAATGGLPYSYQFQATGVGPDPITYSATGLPGWAQLAATTGILSGTPTVDGTYSFSVTANNGVANGTTVQISLVVAQTANVFNVAAGTSYTVPSGTYAGGTTFNVGANATLTIDAGTFTGGAIFNVATGAVVSIINDPTFSGTLTGGGGGSVQVGNGRLYVGSGGLTLDFAGGTFEWTSGNMELGNGNLTNLGTMNITGSVNFYNDGVLYNYGTIVQTDGTIYLGTDGLFPSEIDNEAGASYLFESGSGVASTLDNPGVGYGTSIVNAGAIDVTAGSGTSTFSLSGPLTNTGTIEVDSGTLAIDVYDGGVVSQVSGNTLTGGTWNALGGSRLEFPTGTAITDNEASISLGGAGAAIGGIAGLASNSGSFALTGGANFTTAGNFTNSGGLTLGAGGILTVSGSFTQTLTGTLNEQIGGSPASGLFGQVAVSQAAALSGEFNLALVNNFTPLAGSAFAVMSFAQSTGNFTSASGLSPYFTESLGAASLDLVNGSGAAVDLLATSVTVPSQATAGGDVTVAWQATNQSSQAATGSWQDSVYLSTTPTITASSTLLGSVEQSGGLAAGGSYSASLTAAVPALAPGNYYVIVELDSLYQLSDTNRADGTLAATNQLDVSEPALTLGTPANGSFTAANQDVYYGITVPAGDTGDALVATLSSAAASGSIALYVSSGALPTPYDYDEESNTANQVTQTVVVPTAIPGATYYILAQSVSGNAATAGFTLAVTAVSTLTVNAPARPYTGGNSGSSTIEIDGANFSLNTTASLTLGGATIDSSAIQFVNSTRIFTTFNLSGAAAGDYALNVVDGAQTVTEPAVFHVMAASTSSAIQISLSAPSSVRAGRTGVVEVTVTNTGNNDVAAPLLQLTAVGATLKLPSQPAYQGTSLYFLAAGPTGLAGVLTAGESVQVAIQFQSTATSGSIQFQVNQTVDSQAIDFTTFAQQTQPAGASAATWATVIANLSPHIGTTWGDYVAALDQAATRLALRGQGTSDASSLLEFEISQADGVPVGIVSGQVLDAGTGQPLADVAVEDPGEAISTTTDANGAFSLTGVADGVQNLALAGYLIESNPAVTITPTTDALDVVLLATQAGKITGSVTDASSGQPLPNIAVQCTSQTTFQSFYAQTAADGSYTFGTLPADTYTVSISAAGYVSGSIQGIAVALGQTVSGQDFNLVTGATITGTVSPAASEAAGGALQVVAQAVGGSNTNYLGSVSGDNYSINDLPAGDYNVTISLSGYLSATLTNVTVAAGATVNAAAASLAVAASISGDVNTTDPTVPAAGELIGLYNDGTLVESLTTDSNGAFTFTGLSPGTYTASLVQASPSPLEADPTVSVVAGGNVTGADISIVPGGVIAGQATNATTGGPLANITVSLTNSGGTVSTTTTDANGHFQFPHLTAGTYVVQLPLNGTNATQTVLVTALDGTVVTANLSDALAAALTGTVSDREGNPLANVSVALLQNGQVIDAQATDNTGSYLFDLVNSGTYSIQVYSEAASFPQTTEIQVPAGATVTQNFQAGSGSIQVTSVDSAQAVADDTISLYLNVGGNVLLAGLATVDAMGVTTFTNLVTGDYTIEVNGPNNHGGTATTTLALGSQQQLVTVNLLQQDSLSGAISDSEGNAVSGAYIELVSSSNSSVQRSAQSASDGTYSFSNLDAGTYDLTAFLDGYAPVVNQTIVVSGSTTFNMTLSTSTTTISGKVESADGSSVAHATVVIVDASGQPLAIETTGNDGTFTTTSALGTNLVVVAGESGYSTSAPVQITISSGATVNVGTITIQPASVADPDSSSSFYSPLPSWLATIPSQVQAFIDQICLSPTAADVPAVPACLQDQQSLMDLHQNVLDAIATRDADAAQLRQAALSVDKDAAIATTLYGAADAVYVGAAFGIAVALAVLTPEIEAATVFGGVSAGFAISALSLLSGIQNYLLQNQGEWQALSGSTSGADMQSKAGAAVEGASNLYSAISGAAYWFKTTNVGAFLAGTAGTVLGSALSAASVILNDPFKEAVAEAVVLDTDEATYKYWFNTYAMDRDTATRFFNNYTAALQDAEANNDPCHPLPPPPNPPVPPTNRGPTVKTPVVNPQDPNAIIGPAGYGTPGFIQASNATLPYSVEFENDGTAAALDVTVTEQLDANLNWSTFQFGSFGFGSIDVTVPAGLTQYQTTVSYENADGSSLNVQLSLAFNVQTGLLTADFVSLDPLTGQTPAEVFDGFLYPESDSPIGSDGYVQYTIQLNAGLTTGATSSQQASVVFDTNAAIITSPPALNTIDAAPPASSVLPLPATETSPSFTVSWSGQDDPGGSGLAGYDVYVSDDNGPFTLWQSETTETSAVYSGQFGHTYGFYSVATDNVGNIQPTPDAAQATTIIKASPTITTTASPSIFGYPLFLGLSVPTLSDTAVVAGGYNETGSLVFTLSGPNGFSYTQNVPLSGNGTYTASDTLPTTGTVAGGYTWSVSYAGDANNNSATDQGGPDEQSLVVKANPTITSTASPAVTLGTTAPTLSDSAVVGGGYYETGSLVFTLAGPNGFSYTQSDSLSGNGTYTASDTLPTTGTVAGTYTWSVSYAGDANNFGAADQGGTVEQTVVSPANPTIFSAASPSIFGYPLFLGLSVPTLSDTAVVAGGYYETGSLVFTLSGPNGFSYTPSDPLNGNGTYTASDTLPTTGTVAGSYTWSVSYAGDANNNSAQDQGGPDEQSLVAKANPTITTTASPAVTLGTTAPTLSDTAVVAGGYYETGSLVFTLTGPNGFSYTQNDPLNGNGTYTASDTLPTAGTVAGTYTWSVSYAGDANNFGATDQGGMAEQTVVSPANATIFSAASPSLSGYPLFLGLSVPTLSDTAVVAGGYYETGSLVFTLSGPNGFMYTQSDPLSGNGTYIASDTLPTTGTVAGAYTWSVSYAGDANNNSAQDQGGPDEQSLVAKANPTITTTASPAVTLGTTAPTLSDSAVVAGGYYETGSLIFTLSGPNGFSYTQSDALSGNGTYTASDTLPTTGTVAGTYTWSVSYAGDANNFGATDQGGSTEQTVVSAAKPTINVGAGAPVLIGTGLPLSASITVAGGYFEGGTITFTLYNPNDVSVYTDTATVNGNGSYSASGGKATGSAVPTVAGIYQWVVDYSGDVNNAAVSTVMGATPEAAVGAGATVVGNSLYLVGGNTNDQVSVQPIGSSNTGSSGFQLNAALNNISVHNTDFGTDPAHPITRIIVSGFGGNDNIVFAPTLTLAAVVVEGDGNDNILLAGGNNSITAGKGNDNIVAGDGTNVIMLGDGTDNVVAGSGNNVVTLGRGNDNVAVGGGDNVIVAGTGNDNIQVGNGDNLIVGGLGHDNIQAGNGNNILIDGTVSQTAEALEAVLQEWIDDIAAGKSAAAIASDLGQSLTVKYNSSNANTLHAGTGLDWFWSTYAKDNVNNKPGDLLN